MAALSFLQLYLATAAVCVAGWQIGRCRGRPTVGPGRGRALESATSRR